MAESNYEGKELLIYIFSTFNKNIDDKFFIFDRLFINKVLYS